MKTIMKFPHGHRVNANLKQAIYYRRDGEFLGADEYRELWASFRQFGERRAKAYLWDSTSSPHSNAQEISLGSAVELEQLISPNCTHIYGGVEYVRKDVARDDVLDGDFDFSCCSESAWSGVDTPPRSSIRISDDWLSRIGSDAVLQVMHQHFRLADRYRPQYGLIDYSASEDTFGGMVFDSITLMKSSLQRWVEQSLWYQSRFDANRLRGIYWGNYLSRSVIDQLNHHGDFLSRYREVAVDGNGKPTALIWEFEHGAFVSLGLDPAYDCSPGEMLSFSLQANCNWLALQFSRAGIL